MHLRADLHVHLVGDKHDKRVLGRGNSKERTVRSRAKKKVYWVTKPSADVGSAMSTSTESHEVAYDSPRGPYEICTPPVPQAAIYCPLPPITKDEWENWNRRGTRYPQRIIVKLPDPVRAISQRANTVISPNSSIDSQNIISANGSSRESETSSQSARDRTLSNDNLVIPTDGSKATQRPLPNRSEESNVNTTAQTQFITSNSSAVRDSLEEKKDPINDTLAEAFSRWSIMSTDAMVGKASARLSLMDPDRVLAPSIFDLQHSAPPKFSNSEGTQSENRGTEGTSKDPAFTSTQNVDIMFNDIIEETQGSANGLGATPASLGPLPAEAISFNNDPSKSVISGEVDHEMKDVQVDEPADVTEAKAASKDIDLSVTGDQLDLDMEEPKEIEPSCPSLDPSPDQESVEIQDAGPSPREDPMLAESPNDDNEMPDAVDNQKNPTVQVSQDPSTSFSSGTSQVEQMATAPNDSPSVEMCDAPIASAPSLIPNESMVTEDCHDRSNLHQIPSYPPLNKGPASMVSSWASNQHLASRQDQAISAQKTVGQSVPFPSSSLPFPNQASSSHSSGSSGPIPATPSPTPKFSVVAEMKYSTGKDDSKSSLKRSHDESFMSLSQFVPENEAPAKPEAPSSSHGGIPGLATQNRGMLDPKARLERPKSTPMMLGTAPSESIPSSSAICSSSPANATMRDPYQPSECSRDGSFATPVSSKFSEVDLISNLHDAGQFAQLRTPPVYILKGDIPDALENAVSLSNFWRDVTIKALTIIYLHGYRPLEAFRQACLDGVLPHGSEGLDWCREICHDHLWALNCQKIDNNQVKFPNIRQKDKTEVDEVVRNCKNGWLYLLEDSVYQNYKLGNTSKWRQMDEFVAKQTSQDPNAEYSGTKLEQIFKDAGWQRLSEETGECRRLKRLLHDEWNAGQAYDKARQQICLRGLNQALKKTPRFLRQIYDRYMHGSGNPHAAVWTLTPRVIPKEFAREEHPLDSRTEPPVKQKVHFTNKVEITDAQAKLLQQIKRIVLELDAKGAFGNPRIN